MFYSTNDLHFSFISPLEYLGGRDPKDLISRYARVNSTIVDVLKMCGYDTSLGRTSIRINNGRIVAGTARKEKRFASLQQGGILVDNYDDDIFRLTMAREDEIEAWRGRVLTLGEINPNHRRVASTLKKMVNVPYTDLSYTEITMARKLAEEFYSNRTWVLSGKKTAGLCLVAEYTKDNEEGVIVNAAA